MAINSYSLCPGGRGKKIQFCCPDHIKDLEQIDRMLEGEQYAAGLAFVENLEKKSPGCACLTEAKCMFQRMIGLWEEAYETASSFVEREPKNVIALTELATSAALIDKPQESVSRLVDAIENIEGDQFPVAVVQAMLTVGLALYEGGNVFAAVAIAKQLQAFAPQDQATNAFLYRCLGSESVPLMLKEQVFDLTAPDSFEKKNEYDQAIAFLSRGQWKRGRAVLESILPCAKSWPNLYRNLGVVEMWFVNDEKGREYFNLYLDSDGVDSEDAIDCEQLLALLATPTWDDVEFMEKRVYTVPEFDAAFEKLLSAKTLTVNARLQPPDSSEVRPKSSFVVLDRPLCDKTIDLSLDDVSTQLGFLFAYGRQTTREARLELYAQSSFVADAEKALFDVLGATPVCETTEVLQDQPILWTTSSSSPRFQFKDPTKLTAETLNKLFDEFFDSFATTWFNHPYKFLDNKSPKDVLETSQGKRRVEAFVRVVSSLFTSEYYGKVSTLLRKRASLPAPLPVVPPNDFATPEEMNEFFRKTPIWRWERLQIDNLKSSALIELFRVANVVAPLNVKERFAHELLARPVGEVQYEERAGAYSILIDSAVVKMNTDRALELIAEAGAYAKSIGHSDGQWKALEVITRFRRQEFEKVRSLAEQVFRDYKDDKQAIQMLQSFFEELNAQAQIQRQYLEARQSATAQTSAPLRPDFQSSGFGATQRQDAEKSGDVREPGGRLWTPGDSSDRPGSNGGSGLWLPD